MQGIGQATIALALLAWAVIAAAPAQAEETVPLETVVAEVEPAALVIYGTHRETGAPLQGTGISVDDSGLVLATAHQVADATSLTGANDDFRCRLEVIAWDTTKDLALLRAHPPVPAAVPVGDAAALVKGSAVFVLSAPRGLRLTLTTGSIATTGITLDDQPRVQVDMTLAEGASGGPVFNRQGHLVGIVAARAEGLDGFTIVTPVSEAYGLLDMHGVALPDGARGAIEPDEARQAAVAAYNRGVEASDAREKVRHYEAAVGYANDFFQAWFNLGAARAELEEHTEAAEAYHAAHLLRPDSEPAMRNLGQSLLLAGDPRGALRILDALAEQRPEDARVRNDIGEAHRRMGQFEDAERHFREALELDERHAPAHFNLALALVQLERRAEALEAFERYLSLRPDAPDAADVREAIERIRRDLP